MSETTDITIDESTDNVLLYHRAYEDEPISETAAAIWSLIQEAYQMSTGDRDLVLGLDVEGHRNDAGGHTDGYYLFLNRVCIGPLAGFVDSLITPLDSFDVSALSLAEAYALDAERVENDEGEQAFDMGTSDDYMALTTPDQIREELSDVDPAELVHSITLFADYDGDNLEWGFDPV